MSSVDDNLPTVNAENLQSNMRTIYYSRTFLSIIAGVIAGVLGFTNVTGFVFYFLVMAITSLGLLAKAKFSVHAHFDSWNRVILDGFLGGLMSFVLFWTYSREDAELLEGAAADLLGFHAPVMCAPGIANIKSRKWVCKF